MAERSIAAVLKTVDLRGSGGSNPSLSAQSTNSPPQGRGVKKKMMKVFAAMFCAAMVFALTGCSKDMEKDIVGTWKVTDVTMTWSYNGQPYTESEPIEDDLRLIFNEDKTFQATTNGDVEASGTWSLKDDQLTMINDSDGDLGFDTATVKIDGNSMTLTATQTDGESISMKIVMTLQKV